jgi:REP element-mobilizing transposase RayT
MARPVRVEFEGAVYHVTARGNERRRIFRRDEDHRRFLATLEQLVAQFGREPLLTARRNALEAEFNRIVSCFKS